MQCVNLTSEGFVMKVEPPGGDINQCAYVLQTPHEMNVVKLMPFYMDVPTALALSSAIAVAWAIGHAFGVLGKQI